MQKEKSRKRKIEQAENATQKGSKKKMDAQIPRQNFPRIPESQRNC